AEGAVECLRHVDAGAVGDILDGRAVAGRDGDVRGRPAAHGDREGEGGAWRNSGAGDLADLDRAEVGLVREGDILLGVCNDHKGSGPTGEIDACAARIAADAEDAEAAVESLCNLHGTFRNRRQRSAAAG